MGVPAGMFAAAACLLGTAFAAWSATVSPLALPSRFEILPAR